jgi:hypothetical protein
MGELGEAETQVSAQIIQFVRKVDSGRRSFQHGVIVDALEKALEMDAIIVQTIYDRSGSGPEVCGLRGRGPGLPENGIFRRIFLRPSYRRS